MVIITKHDVCYSIQITVLALDRLKYCSTPINPGSGHSDVYLIFIEDLPRMGIEFNRATVRNTVYERY